MKQKTLPIILLTLVILLCGCSSSSETDVVAPDGMIGFFNEEHSDYTAFVPSLWTVDMSTGTLSAVSPAGFSNVSITAQDIDDTTTLDSYWADYEKDFKATFQDMKYEGEVPTTDMLSGVPANRYVYTAKVTNKDFKYMQVVCIHNGKVYVITYTSTPEDYDTYVEDVEKILDNFSFND